MKVVAAKADSYTYSEIERAVRELFQELGGLTKYIEAGDKVLVKPNMLEGLPPDRAVTTHP